MSFHNLAKTDLVEGQKKFLDESRPEVISQLSERRPGPEEGESAGTSTHLLHRHDRPLNLCVNKLTQIYLKQLIHSNIKHLTNHFQ